MPKTKLRELLTELQGELDNAEAVGPKARDQLQDVVTSIEEVLDDGDPTSSLPASEDDSLDDRLRAAAVDFETSHPRVAFLVERAMKLLSDIGI